MDFLSMINGLTLIYAIFRLGRIDPGKFKNFILIILVAISATISILLKRVWVFFVLESTILILFDIFYDEEPFKGQIIWIIPLFTVVSAITILFPLQNTIPAVLGVTLLVIWFIKSQLTWDKTILVNCIFLFLIFVKPLWLGCILSVLIFLALDSILARFQTKFDMTTKEFQQSLLQSQYNEIKEIYLQMRGWRHDYHNHMQTMKAYLAMDNLKDLEEYLDELEEDLKGIDTMVKSGNNMIDAIINSKLSLAKKDSIKLNVKIKVLPKLSISDVDLCVIIGNLLDNAIEASRKIPEENRFIRLYMDTVGQQFYLSIQNSAKEILNFNERNYISSKRGEHGLGMKRVRLLVEKYKGYLNLQNEPGIFASEVTIPLVDTVKNVD